MSTKPTQNATDFNTTHLPLSLTYETWALGVVAPLLAILTLWTVFGNFLVFVSLCRFHKLRSTSNLLIGNLAVSDFLLALTVMPMSSVTDLLGYWVFGQIMCNVWLSVDVLYCTASIWSLVAIAFDRFTATVFPVWYRDSRNNQRILTYASLVWVLSVLICLPPLIGWDGKKLENPKERFRKSYQYNNATHRHDCILFNEPNYVIYSAMGSFIIPLVVMIILYMKIFAVLQQRAQILREKQRKKTQAGVPSSHSNRPTELGLSIQPDNTESTVINALTPIGLSTENLPSTPSPTRRGSNGGGGGGFVNRFARFSRKAAAGGVRGTSNFVNWKQRNQHSEQESLLKADRREQRATKRMALIIALFVLCWIPFTMMYMIRSLCGEERCPDYLHLRMFVIWLGYANSGLNPILYTLFNDDFRAAFATLLCGKEFSKRVRNQRK